MANHNEGNRLQKLKGSDFEVRDGYTDIRGWDVKDNSGRTIGEVEELLFDPTSRKVRYMVVELDDNELGLDEEKEVLIPIGVAQLHEKDDDVIIPNITAEQLNSLPAYDEDNFSADHEHSIRNVFAGVGGMGLAGAAAATSAVPVGGTTGNDFYEHDHYNEDNLYRNRRQATDSDAIPVIREDLEVGKREVETGGVRVRTQIVEEEAVEHVNLREEHVQVERVPVDRAATESDIREENIELTERAEVPVVNKEARVVEEISLSKEVTERDETIHDTLRNTEVDVDKIEGNDRLRRDDDTGRI
ncbi:conserved domain-containing protein [Cnuella takakiae]|uniref:Conserved domain-containing protein n=1 Tax=Cnuella takakiae TaxID=1302690 RepID=A0A1M4TG03_9BACT|nr:PRC and DUF2382 domain-containing protein [Cnuella takakiae]OLY90733.1 hypothetical protein BUE76_01580 [Cnuella takakiae]SHE43459.1 conserved domain-containing protein [Cnuella takakiae]